MIRGIHMQDVKGVTTAQELTGCDIFIGPNGIGKTTRLQSLGIAMLGYVPGKGRLEAETFKLSSNSNRMEIGLQNDGFQFTRSFIRKESTDKKSGVPKVSISQDVTVSPSKGEKGVTAKQARIIAEIGNFPIMLDFNEFLGLSDTKRREFFYSLSPSTSSAWDRDKVEEYLCDSLLTIELEVNNPDQYAAYKELIIECLKQWPVTMDFQGGLQSMYEWAKAKQTHWNSEKKDDQGAVRKLSELKNKLEETDRFIAQNKIELESLQQQLIGVEKELSASEEKKKAVETRLNRIGVLEKAIAALKESKIVDNSVEIDKQIAELQEQIKTVDVTEDVSKLEDALTVNDNRSSELVKARDKLYKEIADIEGTIKALEKVTATIDGQDGYCALSSMMPKKKIKCDKDFSGVRKFVEAEKANGLAAITDIRKAYDDMGRELDEELLPKNKELKAKVKELQTGFHAQVTENERIRKQVAQLEKDKADTANAITRRDDQIKLHENELLELQGTPVEPVAPTDILTLRANGLREQIEALKIKIDEQTKAKTTMSNLKTSMIDSKRSGYYASGSKYLAEAIGAKGIQGELVKETLEPVREEVQANLGLMGVTKEFFFHTESDTGKEIFQFGWRNDRGEERNFDALSTGEQLLLLVALMVTIICRINPKEKVLAIDNIENLDGGNFRRALDGLAKLKEKLDNIILAGVINCEGRKGESATEYFLGGVNVKDIPEWRIWDLGQKKEAKADEVA